MHGNATPAMNRASRIGRIERIAIDRGREAGPGLMAKSSSAQLAPVAGGPIVEICQRNLLRERPIRKLIE